MFCTLSQILLVWYLKELNLTNVSRHDVNYLSTPNFENIRRKIKIITVLAKFWKCKMGIIEELISATATPYY